MVDAAKLRWFDSRVVQCQEDFQKQSKRFQGINSEDNLNDRYNSRDAFLVKPSMTLGNYSSLNNFQREKIRFIDQMEFSNLNKLCRPPASYLGQCTYFFDDLGDNFSNETIDLHMLKHVTRSMKFSPPKVFSKVPF